jgi:hypothetical protein
VTASALRGLAGQREVRVNVATVAALEDPDPPPSIQTLPSADAGDIGRFDPNAGVVHVRLVEFSTGEGIVYTREYRRWRAELGGFRLHPTIISLGEELVDVEAISIDIVAWSREGDR